MTATSTPGDPSSTQELDGSGDQEASGDASSGTTGIGDTSTTSVADTTAANTSRAEDTASETGTTSSESGSTGTTTGGVGAVDYEECSEDEDCAGGLVCNDFTEYCSLECDGRSNNCPAPASGELSPSCSGSSDTCVLYCDSSDECPDGMSCLFVLIGSDVCGY